MSHRRLIAFAAAALLLLALFGAAMITLHPAELSDDAPAPPADAAQVARGAYLARAGNCAGCHTARGGAPYAGGRGIETPFGSVYASNLTPDAATGIGRWTSEHFWRALHLGRSRDGRMLYPAFPYPNYTLVTREDADALYAFFMSLPPVRQANRTHALRFPYSTQPALAVWRALYFRAGRFAKDAARSAEWNRGAYLVQGLGHCNACHASRNALGATSGTLDLGGGLIPVQNWYAPALTSTREAGVQHWDAAQVVRLLKSGVASGASVLGPMAEVVAGSTQHLSDGDLLAMADYLRSLPKSDPPPLAPAEASAAASAARSRVGAHVLERGATLYEHHCAGCHGKQGEGVAGAYPRLAGNRAVTMDPPANLVHVVLGGGFPPSTAGNPRPFGMPPYASLLGDEDIAALLNFIRLGFGNQAGAVSTYDVLRYRSALRP
jgi:mono/diheme cytochrome c family protein